MLLFVGSFGLPLSTRHFVSLPITFLTGVAAIKGVFTGSFASLALNRQRPLHELALIASLSWMYVAPFPQPHIVVFGIVFPNPFGAQTLGPTQMANEGCVVIDASTPFQCTQQPTLGFVNVSFLSLRQCLVLVQTVP